MYELNECLAVPDIAISHNGFIFGSADFFTEEILFRGNNGFIEKTILNGIGKYVFRIENVNNEQGLINFSMTQSTPNLADRFYKFFVIREASYTEAYDVYNKITEFYSSNKQKPNSSTQRPKFSMVIADPFYIDSIGVVAPGEVCDGPINVGDKVELLNRQGLFTGNAVVSDIRKLEDGHYVTASVGEMASLVLTGIDKSTAINSTFVIIRSDNQIANFLAYLLNIIE